MREIILNIVWVLLVTVHPVDRPWVAFCWQGKTYQFRALPFGIAHAPRLFTKLMTRVLEPLRSQGLRLTFYLDDICLLASSKEQARQHGLILKNHLQSSGFLLSRTKCCWTPQQSQLFLGFIFNSKEMSITLPTEKLRKIQRDANQLIKAPSLPVRKLAAIAGLLQSTIPAVFPARHRTWSLIKNIHQGLAEHPKHWDRQVQVSQDTKADAAWWLCHLAAWNGCSMLPEEASIVIETDASDSGWGYFAAKSVNAPATSDYGHWSLDEYHMSINWRELRAVLHALEKNASHWARQIVQVRTDNMTTRAILMKQGSRQHIHLHALATKIAATCQTHKIRLFATYLPGKENQIADALSRIQLNPQHEAMLPKHHFKVIQQRFGNRSIDLFASHQNRQLPQYFSLHPDPQALAQDAFQQTWPTGAYAYPPWRMVNKVLQEIRTEAIRDLVLITPHWQTQPWWGELVLYR